MLAVTLRRDTSERCPYLRLSNLFPVPPLFPVAETLIAALFASRTNEQEQSVAARR